MANKKILIIDDDPDILETAKLVLESNGFSAVTAGNEEEALDVFSKEKPDMVLCDMMMEAVDSGSKIASQIRKQNQSIPIFLLSNIGNATSVTIDISASGFTGAFQKPFDPKSLISIVKKALQ